jgi:CubicO group peptidase (beta-lactamase class C family)
MANSGEIDGVRLLSAATAEAVHTGVSQKYDHILLEESRFTQGGFGEFLLNSTSQETTLGRSSAIGGVDVPSSLKGEAFYGWGGMGGSLFIWSPGLQVAFSYTMTGMSPFVIGGPRTQRLVTALLKALAEVRSASTTGSGSS